MYQMASRRLKVTRALTGPKTYYIIVIGNSETEEKLSNVLLNERCDK